MFSAFIGGLISLAATCLGAVILPASKKIKSLRGLHLSLNFSVGLIISASVLLIYPEIATAGSDNKNLIYSLFGLVGGFLLINFSQKATELISKNKASTGKIILISSLILHNFPEGMGAGASMMGMSSYYLITLQTALILQNIVEGFLVALSIYGLGFSLTAAVLGGVGSGFVELLGAITAGYAVDQAAHFLPFSLCFAGAAMLTAVAHDLNFSEIFSSKKQFAQFLVGLSALPVLNFITSNLV